MGGAIYPFLKNNLAASTLHDFSLWTSSYSTTNPPPQELTTKVFNSELQSPIGTAAGIDRNALAPHLYKLGFGFVEIGSVVPVAERRSSGAEEINHLGSKWTATEERLGVNWVKFKLKDWGNSFRGISIQPNLESQRAIPHFCDEEYVLCFNEMYPFADYLVVNVADTQPNKLSQYKDLRRLRKLIRKLVDARDVQIGMSVACHLTGHNLPKPKKLVPSILVKVESNYEKPKELVDLCIEEGVEGLLVGGTDSEGQGGTHLTKSSLETLKEVYTHSKGKLVIISCGGVTSGKEVLERIKHGASLVQVYSLVVLEGPQVIHRLNQELFEAMKEQGFSTLSEAFGVNIN